jgi:hypothetical protein
MPFFGRDDTETVDVLDRPPRCQVCANNVFSKLRAQMHEVVMTFFNLEWASPS